MKRSKQFGLYPLVTKRKRQTTIDNITIQSEHESDSITKSHDIDNENNDEAYTSDAFCKVVLPDCWSVEQYNYFCKRYEWLEVRHGRLGCKMCEKIKSLGIEQKKHMHISSQWKNFAIKCYGESKLVQQASLRKKMKEHDESQSHSKVVSMLKAKEQISIVKYEQNKDEILQTVRIFNIVYSLIKSNKPLSDVFREIELHEKNGIDCGLKSISHHTINMITTNIVNHIACELRKEIFGKLIAQKSKICIIVDEILLMSVYTLIIYLRCEAKEAESPINIFVDVIEIYSKSVSNIVDKLLKCLESHGFDEGYLKANLIAFCYDGSSATMGRESGVAANIFSKFSGIILWPCLSHKLKLILEDAIRNINEVNHFKIFFDKLYALYHQSYKNQNELNAIAYDLGVQINKIPQSHQYWSSCNLDAALEVWKNYPALHAYLETQTEWQGLKERLESTNFITNLALTIDILQQLTYLSEALQESNASIALGDRLVKKTIRVLQAMKDDKGEYELKVADIIKSDTYRYIPFNHEDGKIKLLPKLQLYQNVIDQMKMLLISSANSNVISFNEHETTKTSDELLNCFRLLESETWPNDTFTPWLEGEEKLMILNQQIKFDIPVKDFRDYIDNVDLKWKAIPKTVIRAKKIVKIVAVGTAEVERGFDVMNSIIMKERNSLLVHNTSNLMCIKILGKPIDRFNAEPFVESWLKNHHISTYDLSNLRHNVIKKYNQNEETVWKLLT